MLNPGDLLDKRYEIEEKIGQGGMSYVYRAKDTKLGRTVAIKVLKEEFSSDEEFIRKFRNEAMSAAKLSHPNIVAAYDAVDEGDLHYIIMELVEGITLKNYIARKGQLSNRETLGIALQAVEGIAEAHKKGIVHRDIKPQNMIISKDGKVKVADFGIAKAVSGETMSAAVIGSVHYISPEQARSGVADMRSDLYSLGISMYEMITGRVPYQGENTVNVVMAHISETMVPPSVYRPDIYPALCDIILKLTKKNPEERYQSAQELIADLKRCAKEPDGHFVHLYESVPSSRLSRNGEASPDAENHAEAGQNSAGISSGEANASSRQGNEQNGETERGIASEAGAQVAGMAALSGETAQKEGGSQTADTMLLPPHAAAKGRPAEESAGDTTCFAPVSDWQKHSGAQSDRQSLSRSGETGEGTEHGDADGQEEEEDTAENGILQLKRLTRYGGVIAAGVIVLVLVLIAAGTSFGLLRGFSPAAESTAEQAAADTGAVESASESAIDFTIPIQGVELMPSLVGMTEDAARAKLQGLQVSMDSAKTDYSDVYTEGRIMEQNPKEGEALTPGTTVVVTVSLGTKINDTLKKLRGMTKDEAIKALADVGVHVGPAFEHSFSDEVEKGLVLGYILDESAENQDGDEVKKGSTVNLILSDGSELESVRMPLLVGMTTEAADTLLRSLGLGIGTISEEASATVKAGLVSWQSVEANQEVPRGSTVDLHVSIGTADIGATTPGGLSAGTTETGETTGDAAKPGRQEADDSYYGRIDTTCVVGTANGPSDAARQIMVSIRLVQRGTDSTEYTTLESAKPVSAGSRIPVSFSSIKGLPGVSTGTVQVVDAETGELYGSYVVNFAPRRS